MEVENLLEIAEDGLITGEFDKSLEIINRLIEENPSERAYYLKGYLFYCKYEYDKAIPELKYVIENYPQNDEAYYYLAQISTSMGNYMEAREYIGKAHECDGENIDYLGDFISLEQVLKNYDHCIELCNELLDELSENTFALNARGFCQMKKGDPDAAIEDFRKCIQENEADFVAWNYLGLAMIEKGNYEDAASAFQSSLRINPVFSDGYSNWGYLFHLEGDEEKALLYLNRALELDPEDSAVYRKRAEVYLKLDQKTEARADLVKADELGYSELYDGQVQEMLVALDE